MGKIKRAARTTFPRAGAVPRTKSNEDHSGKSSSPGRGALRAAPESGSGRDKLAMPAADDSALDEWLEPDEDTDVDQWLHEHGVVDDPDR
jgi:hypothetical protein